MARCSLEIESEASYEFIIKVLKPKITTMTSADPGEPLVVYLGAAGELVAPDGSQSSSSSSSMRSFHESRAGGSACAPSSPACAVGGAESDCAPGPPRGLVLPPPCGSCGATTALVMQVCYTRKERHIISKTRDETREADQSSTDFHFLILHPPSPKKNRSTLRSCPRIRTAPFSSLHACRTGRGARGSRNPGSR
jgi:hypothetical protein